ncbi:MAG: signal peptidase I [Bacilli bacterium]|nr:signal peptidase I [Bacilli bacterium]
MKQEKYSSSMAVFKLIANIISWTAFALLLVVAAFLLYLTVAAKIYAKKGMDFEPMLSLYTIISPSMEPNLKVYDIIVDKRIDSVNDIQIGDVITFISTSNISSNKTITHRVIDIIIDNNGNYQYKTKGDNNLSPDPAYAEYNNVIGKVLFKVPQLGRVQFFLANQGGWLVVVVIPAIIIILKDILKISKLSKINKKAEVITVKKEEAEEQERLRRQEEEEERKRRLKEKFNHYDRF